MEIINIEKTNSGIYYTVKVVNKLIQVNKLLEILDNISDYQDKYGKYDVDLIKEDILNPRTHIVKVPKDSKEITCTCKNGLFKKTYCRHIKEVLKYRNGNI